jgi:hypothetical protein
MELLAFATVASLAAGAPPRWQPLASIVPLTIPAAIEPEDTKKLESRKRSSMKTLHRAFGITTWISLGFTNAIGTARYANVIGFGQPLCNEGGSPILGRTWGCGDGLKYQHLISASFTSLSYATTRTIAGLMPDPYGAAEGDDIGAKKLRIHRALSWVHLVGMIAMPILGLATSATDDVDKRKTLATAHLITGYTTFAAVSTAAVIMIF